MGTSIGTVGVRAVFLVERVVLRVISVIFAVSESIDVSREWGPAAAYMGS